MNVTGVTRRFIFYKDNHTETATETKLREIIEQAAADIKFYDRMYNELREMYIKEKINFDFGRPAPDTNNYFERVGALSGLSDAMKKTHKKQLHAVQIEMQCRIALNLERPNMAEMYPETIIERR